MKNKFFLAALIGVLLAGGLALAGCGNKCPDGGDCSYTQGSSSADDCSDKCLRSQTGSGEDRNLSCNCD
jgi:hypothetical protein